MVDTQFGLSEEDRQRFQPLSVWEQDHFREGTLVEDELLLPVWKCLGKSEYEGLVSTLEDYGRFCDMLANGGRTLQGFGAHSTGDLTTDDSGPVGGDPRV